MLCVGKAAWLYASCIFSCACGCGRQHGGEVAAPRQAEVTAAQPAPTVHPAEPPPKAPLVVVLVVDQLAGWIAAERLATLPADGGFARLRREGAYYPGLVYTHASTSTAPGHAALFTGLPPNGSGIWANERLDPRTRKPISILLDEHTELVAALPLRAPGSSARSLRSLTIADMLRAAHPDAEIIALSLKDRGAIFGGGRQPDASIWYDGERGTFVTSTAFSPKLPAWALADESDPGRFFDRSWNLLDPAWVARNARTADRQAGEGDPGFGSVFPHELGKAARPAAAFRFTPFADEALFALAAQALAHTHATRTRFLSISLSAFDYIGHVFGPDSWESWDELGRLDQALGGFMKLLDREQTGYSLLLTADHGIVPLPETASDTRARPWCAERHEDAYQRPCAQGSRLQREALGRELELAAREELGPGDWILGLLEPFVYFTPPAKILDVERRGKLVQACSSALTRHREVARVLDVSLLAGDCARGDDDLEGLVCRSLAPGAGDLYIVTQAGSFFETANSPGYGVNHGSPYLYDRTVPLFVRTATHESAARVSAARVSPADFARTVAALLGVDPPPGAAAGRELQR